MPLRVRNRRLLKERRSPNVKDAGTIGKQGIFGILGAMRSIAQATGRIA
jgi:hypothetical protein